MSEPTQAVFSQPGNGEDRLTGFLVNWMLKHMTNAQRAVVVARIDHGEAPWSALLDGILSEVELRRAKATLIGERPALDPEDGGDFKELVRWYDDVADRILEIPEVKRLLIPAFDVHAETYHADAPEQCRLIWHVRHHRFLARCRDCDARWSTTVVSPSMDDATRVALRVIRELGSPPRTPR